MFDVLGAFTQWWLTTRALAPPADEFFRRVGCGTALVLYRQPPFQVQLFLVDPNGEVSDHIHPNVDSVEVYVTGDVYFRQNGKQLLTEEIIRQHHPVGQTIRVPPTDWHGATIGPRGGAFLSIQHWLNGIPPTSVDLDWGGAALDRQHANDLQVAPADDAVIDDGA
jgi:quercetin dioxygenase-like cupin family protein